MLTIIEPAASKALTTYDAVAAEIGEVGESLIVEMILRASATIESFCGRRFALERVRETFALVRHASARTLSRWPLIEVHGVTSNGETLPTDRYEIEHGVLLGAWGRVEVEYTAGYVLPGAGDRTLPYDIERVCIELVKNDWHTRDRDASIRSEDVDGVSNIAFFGSGSTVSAIMAPLAFYRMPVAV